VFYLLRSWEEARGRKRRVGAEEAKERGWWPLLRVGCYVSPLLFC
jgi:hypothetical protein